MPNTPLEHFEDAAPAGGGVEHTASKFYEAAYSGFTSVMSALNPDTKDTSDTGASKLSKLGFPDKSFFDSAEDTPAAADALSPDPPDDGKKTSPRGKESIEAPGKNIVKDPNDAIMLKPPQPKPDTLLDYVERSGQAKEVGAKTADVVRSMTDSLKGPEKEADDNGRKKGLNAIEQLDRSLRGIKGPDGKPLSEADRSALATQLINRELRAQGLGDYEAKEVGGAGGAIPIEIAKPGQPENHRTARIQFPTYDPVTGAKTDVSKVLVSKTVKHGSQKIDGWRGTK